MSRGNDNRSGNGVFRTLLLFVTLGLIGYNTYETAQLKAEVTLLRKGQKVGQGVTREAAPGFPDGNSLLNQARIHVDHAEQWMHLKRYEDARDELTAAAQSFKKATVDTHVLADKILGQLRAASKNLSGASPDTPSAHSIAAQQR